MQRQKQRRAEQQPGQHGKAGDQAFAERYDSAATANAAHARPPCQTSQRCCATLPGQRLRGHEQRQAHHLDQRLCRSDAAHRRGSSQGPQAATAARASSSARDAGAIEPAQACGHVRQQRGRDEIAADDAADACEHGEHQKLDRQAPRRARRPTHRRRARCAASAAAARKLSPIAEWTMKSPTRNDSSPNAVRLR